MTIANIIYGTSIVLNLHTGSIARTGAYYGRGTIPILLDNVGCSGTELRLTACSYSSHTLDCHHGEDAGVTCQPATREYNLITVSAIILIFSWLCSIELHHWGSEACRRKKPTGRKSGDLLLQSVGNGV